ncbi:MAG TPA: universal stress protein [Candidatus Binatia bacterium]|jgi:nucleotide-binding universal stress UspA family protein|nr:universal stress protein [Candidatus Binatia bacterium]
MSQLKRIIVGHDLRTGGETALRSAAVLAKQCGAALRLVHVVEPQHSYQRISHPLTSPYTIEEIAQRTGAKLQGLAASPELIHLQVEYEVRTGKPFVELIIARRAWQADLIVVGGASEGGHFLGSTSERVVRKAMVPVMVAKKGLSAGAKTFLVPTDFSDCAKRAAEETLVLAEGFSGRVIFLHVVDLYPLYAHSYADDMEAFVPLAPPTPEELESEWQAFLSDLSLAKVDWEKRTEEGQAAIAIVRQADQGQTDMIVMGTHGRTGLEYMLMGSVAEKVVRTASCPVLTIRPDAFQFEMP